MAELSRRSFVKAAAMGAVGIAAAGYATGCSPAADASSGSSAPGASIQFDEEYDVVVVGAGLGGAAAALTVASEGDGATCLLVEKGSSPGGNSPFCDNSAMFTDNPDAIYSYLKDYSGDFPPSDAMIRAYADGFGENLEWLKSFGISDEYVKASFLEPSLVEYQEFGSDEGAVANVRLLNPENVEDDKYMHPYLLEKCQEHGVEYRTNAPGERLIQDPETKAIVGVVVNGKNVKANKGVIMALGGFENSPEFLECYVQCGHALPAAATLNTGDGIRMCQEVGAAMWHMSGWAGAWMSPVNLETGTFLIPGVGVARQKIKKFGITVADNGRRFYMDFDGHNVKDLDDYDRYPTMDRHVGSRHGHMQFGGGWPNLPMPATGWFVFDSEGLAAGALGTSFSGDAVGDGWAVTADSIEDLAMQMDVPADELTRTIDQWNVWCERGDDLAFYRPQSTLTPVAVPPFYAARCNSTFLNTDGGAARNEYCQIVTPDGEPIPGLYGVGEFGSFWGHYYQGAGNVGECLVSGRISARHILNS